MYKFEKYPKEEEGRVGKNPPTFSSSLLDEIYRAMDGGGDQDNNETKSKNKSFPKGGTLKPNNRGNKGEKEEEREVLALRRACLIEKWMDQKVREKVVTQGREKTPQFDIDQDPTFFSSTSSSSDSSSGGLSSSDNDSFYGRRRKVYSCPLEGKPPKPIRTGKTESLVYEQRDEARILEDNLIKSKSRAMKIYSNLKKVKQPISPGGKLTTFINSLFQAGQTGKKTPKSPALCSKLSSREESTCSSASFSRSCLSKNSPSTRESLRNGVKRNVTFHPVNVIVDEELKLVEQKKKLYREEPEKGFGLTSLSLPSVRRIGKPKVNEKEDEVKSSQLAEKTRRVEEVAREFLKEYRHQKGNNNVPDTRKDSSNNSNYPFGEEEEEEDDDAMSCTSSDLFELDHLSVIGTNYRYMEELPVYETTHVETNHAITSGLRV